MGFKKDFVWGAASASFQIEGAAYEDGKGASIWDEFCKVDGKVIENHTGDVACDHYHKYKEDTEMFSQIGINAYRFSVSWPRIMPNGTGEVNQKGLDFYNSLLDNLIEKGIEPYVTLFHWDYPLALYNKGGWLNRDSSDWFCEYVDVVTKAFKGKVKNFITFNEPQCFIGLGHIWGLHAPGVELSTKDGLNMVHNMLLAHGKACRIIKSNIPDAKVSYAPTSYSYYPREENEKDIEAARKAMHATKTDRNWIFNSAWFSDPVCLGSYPEDGMKLFEGCLPDIKQDDMKTIYYPLDYLCQNVYQSNIVYLDENGDLQQHLPVGHAQTAMDWQVTPDSLYWVSKFLYERYKLPIVVSENGIAVNDVVSSDGKVHDAARIDYIEKYLKGYKRAADEGIPVDGYFYWSIMDNFEWAFGYTKRFGLTYIDYQTQKRTLKDSAYFYRNVISTNGENI